MPDRETTCRSLPGFQAVMQRAAVPGRREVLDLLERLGDDLGDSVAGPPFFFIEFITEVAEGIDVRAGFPVLEGTPGSEWVPEMDVLERVCSSAESSAVRSALYGSAAASGLISDEYTMDVYPGWSDGDRDTVAVRFVVHSWHRLLWSSLEGEIGTGETRRLRDELGEPSSDWGPGERFDWTDRVLRRLQGVLTEQALFRVVSSCAHVFPSRMLDRLRAVYGEAVAGGATLLGAVDAVRAFMRDSPGGWGEPPERTGTRLVASKGPRDRAAYAAALTPEDRRRAACFCPVIRDRLGDGMSLNFCLCGSGWFRQQWEAVLGRPVTVRVLESLLRGDDRCTFSIDLSEGLPPGDPS